MSGKPVKLDTKLSKCMFSANGEWAVRINDKSLLVTKMNAKKSMSYDVNSEGKLVGISNDGSIIFMMRGNVLYAWEIITNKMIELWDIMLFGSTVFMNSARTYIWYETKKNQNPKKKTKSIHDGFHESTMVLTWVDLSVLSHYSIYVESVHPEATYFTLKSDISTILICYESPLNVVHSVEQTSKIIFSFIDDHFIFNDYEDYYYESIIGKPDDVKRIRRSRYVVGTNKRMILNKSDESALFSYAKPNYVPEPDQVDRNITITFTGPKALHGTYQYNDIKYTSRRTKYVYIDNIFTIQKKFPNLTDDSHYKLENSNQVEMAMWITTEEYFTLDTPDSIYVAFLLEMDSSDIELDEKDIECLDELIDWLIDVPYPKHPDIIEQVKDFIMCSFSDSQRYIDKEVRRRNCDSVSSDSEYF